MRDLTAVPSPAADDARVNLADWVEIKALLSADRNVSREDLVRTLIRAHSLSEENARSTAGDVFRELADRSVSCSRAQSSRVAQYPFSLDKTNTLLSIQKGYFRYPDYGLVYLFLLAITRANMDARSRVLDGIDPTKTFERLCADVLGTFWGGSSDDSGALVFGTARKKKTHTHKFQSNLENLCQRIGEGVGWREDALPPGAGDGKLDVVAWRKFPDARPGGLIGFAQCKTGLHWRSHLTQLQPRTFCGRFMKQALFVDPVRFYMVPARIELLQWENHTRDGGVLFDRCRIVVYATRLSRAVSRDCRRWLGSALARQGRRRFTP